MPKGGTVHCDLSVLLLVVGNRWASHLALTRRASCVPVVPASCLCFISPGICDSGKISDGGAAASLERAGVFWGKCLSTVLGDFPRGL